MRDDTAHWPASYAEGETLAGAEVRVIRVTGVRQTLISNTDPDAVPDLASYPRIGWPEIAPETGFAPTLRRDRILLVSDTPMPTGWNPSTNCTVTDASWSHAIFDVQGKGSAALFRQLGDLSLSHPLRPVVPHLLGIEVFASRYIEQDRFRLHVPQAQAPGGWAGIAARLNPQ
ncbi:MAG: hypothetical protein AB8B58_05620 [Roseobacter sp.]